MSLPLQQANNKRLLCSWSGGKDSCFALMEILNEEFSLSGLFNVINENGDRSRSHGLKPEILRAQATALDVPVIFVSSTWKDYEANYIDALKAVKKEWKVTDVVFGDIDIERHKLWEEKVSSAADMNAHLPLWQKDRRNLVEQMVDSGIKAMIVSCNDTLGFNFLGRTIDKQIIQEFESMGIDPCGENGEYHTLVLDCPLFSEEIDISIGQKLKVGDYNFLDLGLRVK
ncbi:MAG: diphthine--ammonia ligase [Cyclobacteriaceae bacterium]